MLKEDRVQPQEFNFTVVIGAVGRIGDSKKAFHLYSKVKLISLFLYLETE